MTKLPGLIVGMAAALKAPESRVRTAAAQLRKMGMIRSGPRGPGAPEMSPEDATNILLALMYDDELANCHLTVQRLRAAKFVASWKHVAGKHAERVIELPPHRFLSRLAEQDNQAGAITGDPADLGEVLDTMLDWMARYGSVEEGPEKDEPDVVAIGGGGEEYDAFPLYATNVDINVSAPGHQCKIHIDAHYVIWDVEYRWVSPEEEAYYAEPCPDPRFRRRFDALRGPYMTTSRTISDDSLGALGDVLRGYTHEEAEERYGLDGRWVLPYDDANSTAEAGR